jgi:hypothetical protein
MIVAARWISSVRLEPVAVRDRDVVGAAAEQVQ